MIQTPNETATEFDVAFKAQPDTRSFWKEMGTTVVICTGTRNGYWRSNQPESFNQKTAQAVAYRKDMGIKFF